MCLIIFLSRKHQATFDMLQNRTLQCRSRSRSLDTFKIVFFKTAINGWKMLTVVSKSLVLDVTRLQGLSFTLNDRKC